MNPNLVSTRKGPVRWLHLKELWQSGREAAEAINFGRRADQREVMGSKPASIYDLTTAKGVRTDRFVVDYLADTGDGFDATYAMARCLTGEFLPSDDAAPAVAGRADLLVLGGDEVYPVASVTNYDHRLKNVFEEADGAEGGYVVAVPGNHDWYDSLESFRQNFCTSWIPAPGIGAPAHVVPAPNNDVAVGRFPFQARSYCAAKLPFNWWLWTIDIQLDAYTDEHQLDYFYFARAQLGPADRVILCSARPSWVDTPEPKLGYETNRTRLTWFANRMFGNDDPDTDDVPPDHLDHVAVVLSGDSHFYARYTRADSDPESAPQHLVTCGGGGAYLSSTHHLKNRINVPWHLAEPGQSYALANPFPDKSTSRWKLSARFLRTPFVNRPWTPALVVLLTALMALASTAVLRNDTIWSRLAVIAAIGVPAAVTVSLGYVFRPRPYSTARKWVTVLPLGLLHAAGYGAAAALGLWVAAVVDNRGFNLPSWSGAAERLWSNTPCVALAAGTLTQVAATLIVFALYWLIADLVGWHENEFFAGMCLDGYKSFVRIVIGPPVAAQAAGALSAVVYGVRKVPNNRAKTSSLVDPDVQVIDTWDVTPTAPHHTSDT